MWKAERKEEERLIFISFYATVMVGGNETMIWILLDFQKAFHTENINILFNSTRQLTIRMSLVVSASDLHSYWPIMSSTATLFVRVMWPSQQVVHDLFHMSLFMHVCNESKMI